MLICFRLVSHGKRASHVFHFGGPRLVSIDFRPCLPLQLLRRLWVHALSRLLRQRFRNASQVRTGCLSGASSVHGPCSNDAFSPSVHPGGGFTLVELMVTVAVFVLLSAVVLPRYLEARDAALISTMVNQGLSFAKACAVINSSGIGEKPVIAAVDAMRGGVLITQGCQSLTENTGAILEVTWGLARADGVRCLDQLSTLTSQKAILTVSKNNDLTCSFAS